MSIFSFNGLQVNGGGLFDREFSKSLITRDFNDVLKNPFRYVHLFLLHTLLSKKFSENHHAWPVTEGPKLRCYTPPIERGSGPYKSRFLSNQFYLSETLETWSVSRYRWQETTHTLPCSHSTDRSVFYRPAIYRLVCKIVNL